MKFSADKKYKLRKIRERNIAKLYKQLYWGYDIDLNTVLIDKFAINDEYFALGFNTADKVVSMFKLISPQYPHFCVLSPKKVLRHKNEFKKMINEFNSSRTSKRRRIKLVLRENGNIEAHSTEASIKT